MASVDAAIPLIDVRWLRRLEGLAIATQRPQGGWYWGASHLTRRRGRSMEFAGYLPYTWGDDFRTIDWTLYGRFNRLFVKTYHQEVELEVHLLVDATASMGLPKEDRKFSYAITVAQSIGYVALMRHHFARVAALGAPRDRWLTPWLRHRHAFRQLQQFLSRLAPQGQSDFKASVARYLDEAHPHGGSVVVLTDGMIEPETWRLGLALLRHRNLEVTVVQVLGAQELEPARYWRRPVVVDAETGEERLLDARRGAETLRRALVRHNQLLEATCRQLDARLIRARTDTPVDELVFRHFLRAGFFSVVGRAPS